MDVRSHNRAAWDRNVWLGLSPLFQLLRVRRQSCLAGMYEDRYAETECDPISRYTATLIATRAFKQ